jgi:hypothetical protein
MSEPPKIHRERVPESLETLAARLGELRVVFGSAGATALAAVDGDLRGALAARDRGDQAEAIRLIGRGMERLSQLIEGLDPGAAKAMHAVIDHFQRALVRGQAADARDAADFMRKMSGAKIIED